MRRVIFKRSWSEWRDWASVQLSAKFLLSYLLLVAAGLVSEIIGAALIAPIVFEQHLTQFYQVLSRDPTAAGQHLTEAFVTALALSLTVAGVFALAVSVALSLFIARRVSAPLAEMASVTQRIEQGHYAERVRVPVANERDELGHLARSVNGLAASLETVERRRIELMGDVAHELRTPLATLEGYLEGLLDGVVPAEPETWALLHTQANRLHRLVDDLQALSRAEARQVSVRMEAVPPQVVVDMAVEPLRGDFAEHGLTLDVSCPEALPPVRADRDRAAQALTNLLTNALRYTPAPGVVTVTVERVPGTNAMVTADERILFRVTDTGVGLTSDQIAKIFERFYRVDKSQARALGGSGIGLTIARSLAEAMGGSLTAASDGPGHGSEFTLALPVAR